MQIGIESEYEYEYESGRTRMRVLERIRMQIRMRIRQVLPGANPKAPGLFQVRSCVHACECVRVRVQCNNVTPERGAINHVYHFFILVNALCSLLIAGRRGRCNVT